MMRRANNFTRLCTSLVLGLVLLGVTLPITATAQDAGPPPTATTMPGDEALPPQSAPRRGLFAKLSNWRLDQLYKLQQRELRDSQTFEDVTKPPTEEEFLQQLELGEANSLVDGAGERARGSLGSTYPLFITRFMIALFERPLLLFSVLAFLILAFLYLLYSLVVSNE